MAKVREQLLCVFFIWLDCLFELKQSLVDMESAIRIITYK